jgi:hypothetical protein
MAPTRKLSSRGFCMLGMALVVSSCVTWRPYEPGPATSAGKSLPYLLRATRQDSSRIVLTTPFMRADTLYGRLRRDTVSLPVTEIVRLERERLSLDRTLALVIGVPAMALGVTYLVVCGSNDCNPGF